MSIRDQLAPLIRSRGLRQTARDAEIPASVLSDWLAGRRKRRIGDAQLDRLAAALGATVTIQDTTPISTEETHASSNP